MCNDDNGQNNNNNSEHVRVTPARVSRYFVPRNNPVTQRIPPRPSRPVDQGRNQNWGELNINLCIAPGEL